MAFDIDAFRRRFPEFADTEAYPTPQIAFWADFATLQLKQSIWKNAWDTGLSLYVAHEITLARQNTKIAASGGAPGTFGGVANNKTVGSATIGYDSNNTSEKNAGYWNLTNYGRQLYRLMQIFGAGAYQL